MEQEIWNPVIGWSNKYEVSSLGRIRTVSQYNSRGRKIKGHPKVFDTKIGRDGYPVLNVSANGVTRERKIHRLVAESFIPNPSNLECVNHINGVKTDNRVVNLEWCSRASNTIHAHEIGLIPKKKWQTNPAATFTKDQVIEIYKSIETCRKLSKIYDCPYSTIWAIKNGHSWAEITGAQKVVKKLVLSEGVVASIYNSPKTMYALQKEHGFSYTVIRNIKKGITYKSITNI